MAALNTAGALILCIDATANSRDIQIQVMAVMTGSMLSVFAFKGSAEQSG